MFCNLFSVVNSILAYNSSKNFFYLGAFIGGSAISLGDGYRFLPGQYIVSTLRITNGFMPDFGSLSLEWLYCAGYITGTFFLYCYFDQIIPHKEGRARKIWFPFTASFWKSVFGKDPTPDQSKMCGGNVCNDNNALNPDVEKETNPVLLHKADNFQCVQTNNLEITFSGVHGEPVRAVNKLNLTMYEDQIFVLLGHNGAGKTTTMHAMSGWRNLKSKSKFRSYLGREGVCETKNEP